MAENIVQSALSKVRQTANQILRPVQQATQDTRGFVQQGRITPIRGAGELLNQAFPGATTRIQQAVTGQPMQLRDIRTGQVQTVTKPKLFDLGQQLQGFGEVLSPPDIGLQTKQTLTPIIGAERAGQIGYGLQGATSYAPSIFGRTERAAALATLSAPTTESERAALRIGQELPFIVGSGAFGGLRGVLSRGVQGTALGVGMQGVANVATGQDFFKNMGKAATEGALSSWKLALTNALTDKIASQFATLRPLTTQGLETGGRVLKSAIAMGSPQARQIFASTAKRLFQRALLESPIENTVFTTINQMTGKDKRTFTQAWLEDLAGTTAGNLLFAGLVTGKRGVVDFNRDVIDQASQAFTRTTRRLFTDPEFRKGFIRIPEVPGQKGLFDTEAQQAKVAPAQAVIPTNISPTQMTAKEFVNEKLVSKDVFKTMDAFDYVANNYNLFVERGRIPKELNESDVMREILKKTTKDLPNNSRVYWAIAQNPRIEKNIRLEALSKYDKSGMTTDDVIKRLKDEINTQSDISVQAQQARVTPAQAVTPPVTPAQVTPPVTVMPPTKKTTAPVKTAPIGAVERGFSQTVRESGKTAEEVKDIFLKQYYTPINNKATIAEADRIIASNMDEALNLAKNGESSALNNAIAMRLIERLQEQKQFAQAADLLESLSMKPTNQGQAIQMLAYWSKLTPTGALRYTQGLLEKAANQKAQSDAVRLGIEKPPTAEARKIPPALAEKITNIATEIQKLPDGRAKQLKVAELQDAIASAVPPNILRQISSLQTMAQLLNPKTAIRNILGNLLFQVSENASRVASLPADILASLITGKRTLLAPSIQKQAVGMREGFKEGVEEALLGVDTTKMASQFDLPGRTFRNGFLGTLEKILNAELRAPDRAFFRGAFDESLDMQMRLAKTDTPTQEMIEQATYDGMYKTFQDENIATRLFTGLKRALNVGKDFGLGDLIIKYPRTPANLLMRGLEYSPVGFARTVFEMGKPLFGRPFNQRAFAESFGRAAVGSSTVLTGYLLYKLGIITGRPEEDKDVAATQRALGLGQYRVNTSALKRFIVSGFDPNSTKQQVGDQLVTYDWIQPFAIGLSMGANIGQNSNKVNPNGIVNAILASVQEGARTVEEQPLLKGLTTFTQGKSISEAVANTILEAPSSFVPSLLNQITTLTDNVTREVTDPNKFKEMINRVFARLPGLSGTLPARKTVFGTDMERYLDNTNSFFNVMINPAFVTTLKQNEAGQEVLRLYQESGLTEQAPRVVQKKVKVNGQDLQLSGQQISDYQAYVGQKTQRYFEEVMQSPAYNALSDAEKASKLANLMSDINSAAKIELFGDQPKKVSGQTKWLLSGGSLAPGQVAESGNEFLIRKDDGTVDSININAPIVAPKMTGNDIIDKRLMANYKSQITKRTNDIVKLYENGVISFADAELKINELQQKKTTTTTKKLRAKKAKAPKLKKVTMPKLKLTKLPRPKPIKLTPIKPVRFARLKQPKTSRRAKLQTIRVRS